MLYRCVVAALVSTMLCAIAGAQQEKTPNQMDALLAQARKQLAEDGPGSFRAFETLEKALKLEHGNLQAMQLRAQCYYLDTDDAQYDDFSIRWLSQQQHRDRSWRFDGPKGVENPGSNPCRIQATSLAMLGLMSTGSNLRFGQYETELTLGLYYLHSQMRIEGDKVDLRGPKGDMLSHALATCALCELNYLSLADPEVRSTATAAIRFLESAQDPTSGGWGPRPSDAGDLRISVWAIMSLPTAKQNGIEVRAVTRQQAIKFLNSIRHEDGIQYGFTKPGAEPTATAMAWYCRERLGEDTYGAAFGKAVKRLVRESVLDDVERRFFIHQVAHQHGGDIWDEWMKVVMPAVAKGRTVQGIERGSWFNPKDKNAQQGGRLYQSSLNFLTQTTYSRHLFAFGHVDPKVWNEEVKSK